MIDKEGEVAFEFHSFAFFSLCNKSEYLLLTKLVYFALCKKIMKLKTQQTFYKDKNIQIHISQEFSQQLNLDLRLSLGKLYSETLKEIKQQEEKEVLSSVCFGRWNYRE